MKHAILLITIAGFLAGLCTNPVVAQPAATHSHIATDKHQHDAEKASYSCPMHPEVSSHQQGERCPKCNMFLTAVNPEIAKDHKDKTTYICPMHPEVSSHQQGDRCPKCNMFLTAVSPEIAIDHSAETTYICPIHPEVTSHQQGDRCSKCNMLLTAVNPEIAKDHNDKTTYICPMHPEVSSHQQGDRCSKCNMFLTAVSPEIAKDHNDKTTYICPMHPEVSSHQQGDRCPKCNMLLTAVSPEIAKDHSAETTYTCPMHPEVSSQQQGDRCSKCNMFLVVKEEEEEVDHSQHQHPQDEQLATLAVQPTNSAADKVFNTVKPSLITADTEPTIKYVCPMHPHIVSDTQGTCPICGMNLEKVTLGAATEEIVVGVSGGMQQALGMRTQQAEKDTLWRLVKTIGTVEYNQDNISHVHARVTGWVEKLHINNVGQKIKKGQLMYELYSPELINAQDDYLQALDYLEQDNQRGGVLERKARQRLALLGVSSRIIKQLETSGETVFRVPFYAPQDGFVSQMDIRDGMYIQPGNTLIELVDLSTVWVIADVFENEQSWLEQGRPAEVTASAQGLFALESDIDYIYPELDAVTRAMRVRVKLENPNESLRPGTLVDVSLFGGPKHDIITIPTEALILTGRENRVVVQRNDSGFTSVAVKVGIIAQGKAEILTGINEGDHVVVSGQFLLDSEASIQGSLLRLSGADKAPAAHNH
ncbi:efflux RND transporter periplasmic adaptor subunit [Shewanella sp. UCD-KL21]|uniref:efflux RND transporter periplasmic adaptor subunit n=1 Tax=Shewanella sp. UCD-KL21 TaxID=1917164 RepID=UPI0009707B16|nr:efflux RND transporter periplasmic adaptor subunit [Shewanella sp. UCD-KL21]